MFNPSQLKVWTYCITDDDGHVKIGRSVQPYARLNGLQGGCPKKLRIYGAIEGDRELELHLKYRHLRLEGEWFQANDELLAEFSPYSSEAVVVRQFRALPIRQDPDDCEKRQRIYCPQCPSSSATIQEVYWDTEPCGNISIELFVLVCQGHPCGHWFELRIDDNGMIEAMRLNTTLQRREKQYA